MSSEEIRQSFLKFFERKGHKIIPSASLVPENDPTTLFTGSGMQPMLPYLLGIRHPDGSRIVDSQKAFRTGDIDDIGDNRHTTFFEMLGNWSLGDYFKKEQIEWIFEFLTQELKLNPEKIFVTAFIGDQKNGVEKDNEVSKIWQNLFKNAGVLNVFEKDIGSEMDGYKKGMFLEDGKTKARIFFYDAKKNWWSRAGIPENMPIGEPGGPDSEIFYEFSDIRHDQNFGEHCHPNCDCGRYLEIGNNVFMQYKKTESGFENLPQKNIDFGGGLERMVMATENNPDIIETNHHSIIKFLEEKSAKKYKENKENTKAFRIVADHLKASVFLIGDGVLPSNTDHGYFVRRLLRRAVRYFDKLDIVKAKLSDISDIVLSDYKEIYPETYNKREIIKQEIEREEERFRKTLKDGLKQFEWFSRDLKSDDRELPSSIAFDLVTTYGFPFELIEEICQEKGLSINKSSFQNKIEAHKIQSRKGSEQKFKGGLGDNSVISVKYHTTTHLLHQALRDVLGNGVLQKGSNITPERLRFDFSFPRKMTMEEKNKVEASVNEKIKEALPVTYQDLPLEEAQKIGAIGLFEEKYGDKVRVYQIGRFSLELCGGPHVENTHVLGTFKILKEEAVSLGVRRIKAVLN